MISLLLEKKRKLAQNTVLGIEFDNNSLAAVKLDKSSQGYSLVSYDSEIFPAEAYFEGELTSDYLGAVVADIIKTNKLSYFSKLGFTSYNEIDVSKDEVICDKKALEIINKEGASFYLKEYFLKKKYPNSYMDIAYDFYDNLEEKNTLTIYYMPDPKNLGLFYNISKKAKRALSICTLDKLAISSFVEELFLSEISKKEKDSVFLGLYSDKLSIYSFSPKGELKNYESIKIFDPKLTDVNYADEATQLLLRFMDFMSLDFSEDNFIDDQDNQVYIYGLKANFEEIFNSIKELSMKNCQILNPFVNINLENYGDEIKTPYRYVISVAIAMREAL